MNYQIVFASLVNVMRTFISRLEWLNLDSTKCDRKFKYANFDT
jgi:hypothetical protein